MKTRVWGVALAVGLVCGLGAARGAEFPASSGPAKDIPELQVLDRYVGDWELTLRDAAGAEFAASAWHRWAVGGRFLAQACKISNGFELMILRTYDPQAKLYRIWTFDSNGFANTATGVWNEDTKTFITTSKSVVDGKEATSTDEFRFLNADTASWSLIVRDAAGAILSRFSGTGVRKGR